MNKSSLFLDELHSSILVGDGAIGTELFARGAMPYTGVERLNLTAPGMVVKLHRDYVAAGSRVIETNSFAANAIILEKYGMRDRQYELIRAGVNLAREAAGKNVYVAGSVGPVPLVDGEPLPDADLTDVLTDHIAALVENKVDVLILETFIELYQLVTAIKVARRMTDMPIITQMAFEIGGTSSSGDTAEEFVERCIEAGADVVGANCGVGVPAVTTAIEKIAPYQATMSAYMNAGFAERIEGRQVYMAPHEYLAGNALELVRAGVRLVGGCCGTNPDTIRAIVDILSHQRHIKVSDTLVTSVVSEVGKAGAGVETPMVSEPPHGVIAQLNPPIRLDVSSILEKAEKLKNAGVHAITLSDNPMASVRVDVITMAGLLRQKGITVIPHLTGRDKNRIALQSTIKGAHVLGIRHLLCITGDPIRMYHEMNTSGVFDVTSIGLVKLVSEFNSGRRLKGKEQTSFSIGVAVNPNVRSIEGQVDKLKRKIEAGAQFVMTQPIFTEERLDVLENALAREGITIPVYVGIMALQSSHQADFLHYEVPGIYIARSIRNRLARLDNPSDQYKEGIDIAVEFVSKIAHRIYGPYLIPSQNQVDMLLPIIREYRNAVGAVRPEVDDR